MNAWQIALLVIIIVMLIVMVVLYFLGKRAQKKKEEQDAQIAAAAQQVTMLVIDKKRMKLKDAGLPQAVVDQTPKMMRGQKLPFVKAKVGPKIMTFIAEETIFDEIPLKKEVKATVSGLYITGVKGLRGPIEKPQGKKSFRARLTEKYNKLSAEVKEDKEPAPKKASKKK